MSETNTYMLHLKKYHTVLNKIPQATELNKKTSRLTDIEKKLVITRGKGGGTV